MYIIVADILDPNILVSDLQTSLMYELIFLMASI